MLKCRKCGRTNTDDASFCKSCGQELTSETSEHMPNDYIAMQSDPIIPLPHPANKSKQTTFFDIATIFGFVASIVGCFCIWAIFEPLALISAIIGFKTGSKHKSLAISAIIISLISFIIQLFMTLYRSGIVKEWLVHGIFY